MTKSAEETMEIYAAFDLTRCPWSAAQLVGCDPRTVERWVAIRDAGGNPFVRPRRPRLIDPYLEKIEELVERSSGKIRADVVHDRHIVPMGFTGDERTTRRAVAEAKEAFQAGRRRTYRPWVPEPGMWMLCGVLHSIHYGARRNMRRLAPGGGVRPAQGGRGEVLFRIFTGLRGRR